jgi:adenylate cyclase
MRLHGQEVTLQRLRACFLRLHASFRHLLRSQVSFPHLLPSHVSFRQLLRPRSYLLVIILPIAIVIVDALAKWPLLSDMGNFIFDEYQRADSRQWKPQTPVRIVDIDDQSLARIGQWPWPRSKIAELVDRLGELGAAAVAFDIVFAEPDASSPEQIMRLLPPSPARTAIEKEIRSKPSNDAVLAQASARRPTVFGAILDQGASAVDYPTKYGVATAGDNLLSFLPRFTSAIVPLPVLSEAAAGIGAINWLPDHDQVVRRIPIVLALGNTIVPSLTAETLRVAQRASTIIVRDEGRRAHAGINAVKIGDFEIPTSADAEFRIHFTTTEPRRFIPAWSVLNGTVARSEIQDRIVIVGVSAGGLSDQRATPVDASVSGVEIHAQALESIVAGAWLVRPDWARGAEQILAIALALITGALLPRLGAIVAALGVALVIAIVGMASWQAFRAESMLFDPILPMLSTALTYICGAAWLFQLEQRQKRQVREAFGRYVSPEIVARLAERPSSLVLGGETKTLTVMFCDMRGFTPISERYDVQRLTHFMNDYFTPLTDAILTNQGTVDKYIGDALMAFWNAPYDIADHARYAARASLQMVAELEKLNSGWRLDAETRGETYHEVKFGIGLASGECCVGNLGSTRRFDYSVLGDTVNLASRLEGMTESYGIDIVASETTRDLSSDFAWLELDPVRVKGKTQHTRIFYLAGDDTEARSSRFAELIKCHGQMLQAYRIGELGLAAALARDARDIAHSRHRGLYELYEQKCQRSEKTN